MGRSGAVPFDRLTGEVVCAALGAVVERLAPAVLMTHSMSGAYGWRLVERHGGAILAVVAVAPGPPGNVQPEAEVVARSADWVDVRRGDGVRRVPLHEPRLPDMDFVLGKLLGPTTRFPRDRVQAYAASLLPLPPRLMAERQNIDRSQLAVTDTAPFANKPVLMVTGSDDVDHSREVDGAVADWLREIGAAVEFRFLPDEGITGNGHMLMLEDNSDEIAALIAGWLGDQGW
jgi:pimeloyl-ACP methyl ester carboxylesterase